MICEATKEAKLRSRRTCVVIEELDVAVLLSGDGDRQRGMAQHFVDLAGSFCVEAGVRRKENISSKYV